MNRTVHQWWPNQRRLSGIPDEGNRGRWVYLVSLGLQVAQIKWAATRRLPFYVRGLLRAVPIALPPEVCAFAALTDADIEVLMDQHLMLWIRAKSWGECRPFSPSKVMSLDYQDSFEGRYATIAVSEVELRKEEEIQNLPDKPDPEDDTLEEGVVVAHPAPSLHEKAKPKGKGKYKKGNEKGKGRGKRPESRARSGTPLPLPILVTGRGATDCLWGGVMIEPIRETGLRQSNQCFNHALFGHFKIFVREPHVRAVWGRCVSKYSMVLGVEVEFWMEAATGVLERLVGHCLGVCRSQS